MSFFTIVVCCGTLILFAKKTRVFAIMRTKYEISSNLTVSLVRLRNFHTASFSHYQPRSGIHVPKVLNLVPRWVNFHAFSCKFPSKCSILTYGLAFGHCGFLIVNFSYSIFNWTLNHTLKTTSRQKPDETHRKENLDNALLLTWGTPDSTSCTHVIALLSVLRDVRCRI